MICCRFMPEQPTEWYSAGHKCASNICALPISSVRSDGPISVRVLVPRIRWTGGIPVYCDGRAPGSSGHLDLVCNTRSSPVMQRQPLYALHMAGAGTLLGNAFLHRVRAPRARHSPSPVKAGMTPQPSLPHTYHALPNFGPPKFPQRCGLSDLGNHPRFRRVHLPLGGCGVREA